MEKLKWNCSGCDNLLHIREDHKECLLELPMEDNCMSKKIELGEDSHAQCPHCGKIQQIDEAYDYEDDQTTTEFCGNCDKEYKITVSVEHNIYFTSEIIKPIQTKEDNSSPLNNLEEITLIFKDKGESS